jgi:hypothetical protein
MLLNIVKETVMARKPQRAQLRVHSQPEEPTVPNTTSEITSILQDAGEVKRLWERADQMSAQGDAKAIQVIVRAHTFGFFTDINVSAWHKIEERETKTIILDTLLTKLFQIAEPMAADRQRLTRIRFVVPALIKAGGLDVFSLSDRGNILLSTKTEYYKFCGKQEAEGMVAQSVANLDRGARKYLQPEMPKPKKAAVQPQNEAARKPLNKANVVEIGKTLEQRIAAVEPENLTANERSTLQNLLTQLIGIFAVSEDGETVDTDRLTALYRDAA